MRKPTFWFPTWSDKNQAVQLQKMARGLKFRILKVEGLYYICGENKGADQLRGNREADLRLCFRICKTLVFLCRDSNDLHLCFGIYAKSRFSHYMAEIILSHQPSFPEFSTPRFIILSAVKISTILLLFTF